MPLGIDRKFHAAGGLVAHSLALVADSAHVFMDAIALGIAVAATIGAQMPATERQSYGFARFEILAALANSVLLFASRAGNSHGWPRSRRQAKTPTAAKASTLSSDSKAIASISPSRCRVASTRRAPNNTANSATSTTLSLSIGATLLRDKVEQLGR